MDNRLTVVYATDANFWEHIYVSVYSMLVNNPDIGFDVRVLSEAPNERFFQESGKLQTIHNNVSIEWLPVDPGTLRNAPTSSWISLASYYRLFLADLLPASVDRLLYLDGDLVIRGSLQPLLNLDMRDAVLAAVPEWRPSELEQVLESPNKRLGLSEHAPYFNAGVLYINLTMWRSLDIGRQGIDYITINLDKPEKLKYHDQDTLNVVCAGKWLPLGPSFNYHAWSQTEGHLHTATVGVVDPVIGPVVAHFNGEFKPWNGNFKHEFAADYWKYRFQTPYASRRLFIRSQLIRTVKGVARAIRKLPGGDTAVRTVRMRLQRA